MTSAWERYFEAVRAFSAFWGAMFALLEVTMISFLRSTSVRKPSSSSAPRSPVRNQPSSLRTARVASSLP